MQPRDLFPSTFRTAKSTNINYTCIIKDRALGVQIIADLPEQTMLAVSSEFANRLPFSTVGEAIGGKNAENAADVNYVTKYAAEQVWVGTSPIEIPLTLLFDAQKDAYQEVWRPLSLLESMVLPNYSDNLGGIYTSPNFEGSVSVNLGKMYLPQCLLTSVASTYDTKLDKKGYPISGQCEITIKTYRIIGAQEWLKMKGVQKNL
jgi:hypothetical protein